MNAGGTPTPCAFHGWEEGWQACTSPVVGRWISGCGHSKNQKPAFWFCVDHLIAELPRLVSARPLILCDECRREIRADFVTISTQATP